MYLVNIGLCAPTYTETKGPSLLFFLGSVLHKQWRRELMNTQANARHITDISAGNGRVQHRRRKSHLNACTTFCFRRFRLGQYAPRSAALCFLIHYTSLMVRVKICSAKPCNTPYTKTVRPWQALSKWKPFFPSQQMRHLCHFSGAILVVPFCRRPGFCT